MRDRQPLRSLGEALRLIREKEPEASMNMDKLTGEAEELLEHEQSESQRDSGLS